MMLAISVLINNITDELIIFLHRLYWSNKVLNNSLNKNLWRTTSQTISETPNIVNGQHYDVVVIGGGFTGDNSALRLKEKNVSVALLDAQHIGHGGSGRNVGLVNAGLWEDPEIIEETIGTKAGVKLNTMLAQGPNIVFSLIDSHKIDCEATRSGTLHCAHSHRSLSHLRNRLRQDIARGINVDLINQQELKEKTGASSYHGALFYKNAGTIQPLSYLHGLAQVAINKGVNIYQNSPVSSLYYKNKAWHFVINGSTISSDAVIVATNAYNQTLNNLGTSSFTPIHFFQAATQPLNKDILKSIIPEHQGCWDTAMLMSSFRLDNQGRLIVGSVGSLNGSLEQKIHHRWCHKKISSIFPQLENITLDHFWHGRIAYTTDSLPKIVHFGPNAIQIFGYGGRGIGTGTIFGRCAADYILTGDTNDLPIQPVSSYHEHFTSLKSAYYELGSTTIHGFQTLF
jgi:glycine/D-amino acid oxidase-like deaminating enzyme